MGILPKRKKEKGVNKMKRIDNRDLLSDFSPERRKSSVRSILSSLRSSTQNFVSITLASKQISTVEAVNHMFCGLGGINLTYLPQMYLQIGIVPCLGISFFYCLLHPIVVLNIIKKKTVLSNEAEKNLNTIGAIEYLIEGSYLWLQYWMSCIRRLITIFTVSYHLAICIYLVNYLTQLLVLVMGYKNFIAASELTLIMFLVPLTIITNIKNLHGITITSAIANVSMLVAVIIFFFKCVTIKPDWQKIDYFKNMKDIPIFIYLTVTHVWPTCLFLVIEERMYMPEHFGGLRGVFCTSYFLTIISDTVVSIAAAFMFSTFQDEVNPGATLPDYMLTCAIISSCLFKYPLHFYVCVVSLWQNHLHARVPANLRAGWPNLILRVFLNSTVVAFVLFLPFTNKIFQIIQIISCCCLGLILPAMLNIVHNLIRDKRSLIFSLTLNLILIVTGVVTMIISIMGELSNNKQTFVANWTTTSEIMKTPL
ncbi:uncharacterized protein LOC106663483 isoform X2 [Cimex lectularius]|nr:uncharacterized protein LOC106663483 isoform X2 [Cimex lectularius]